MVRISISYETIPASSFRTRTGSIPYLFLKGKDSFLIAKLNFIVNIISNITTISITESYTLYYNSTIIPITDLGELGGDRNIGRGVIVSGMILTTRDRLSGNRIYRVVDDENYQGSINNQKTVNVVEYEIGSDGVIATKSTKNYPIIPLKKEGAVIYSASFYF